MSGPFCFSIKMKQIGRKIKQHVIVYIKCTQYVFYGLILLSCFQSKPFVFAKVFAVSHVLSGLPNLPKQKLMGECD